VSEERRSVSEIARLIAGERREGETSNDDAVRRLATLPPLERERRGRIVASMVDQLMHELPDGTREQVKKRARELAHDRRVLAAHPPIYTFDGEPLRPLPRGGVRVVLDGWRFDKVNGSHTIRMVYARDGRPDDATCTAGPCTWAPRCPHCSVCRGSWCRCTCARFSP